MSLRCIAVLALLGLAGCSDTPVPAHLRIAGGDAERGRALVHSYGCGMCHTIEGIRGANGTVAPPLNRYAERNLVAGILPNAPAYLMAWLMDPPAIEPRTGMPDMGITEAQARDIATFLYTLGAAAVQVYPPSPPLALRGREAPVLQSDYPVSGGYQGSGGTAGGGAGAPGGARPPASSIDGAMEQFVRGARPD